MSKFCSNCGKELPEDAKACPACGERVDNRVQGTPVIVNVENKNVNDNTGSLATNLKNKWVALLLCIFLGAFGAHKFYEGKTLMGVFYLFTLGFCGIGCVIDFWVLLFKPKYYSV